MWWERRCGELVCKVYGKREFLAICCLICVLCIFSEVNCLEVEPFLR